MVRKVEVVRYGLLLLTVLNLCACNEVVLREDLTQEQALEIIAALGEQGIVAHGSKERGGRSRYKVELAGEHYSQAVVLLKERGLPTEARQSSQELLAQRGIVPNPRDFEALRLDRAIAAEVEETLQNNPSIVSARVVVRLNSKGRDPETEPRVAVMLKLRSNAKIEAAEIGEIIRSAVPGVKTENIKVSSSQELPAQPLGDTEGVDNQGYKKTVRVPLVKFLGLWRVPNDDYKSVAISIIIGIVVIFFLGAAIRF